MHQRLPLSAARAQPALHASPPVSVPLRFRPHSQLQQLRRQQPARRLLHTSHRSCQAFTSTSFPVTPTSAPATGTTATPADTSRGWSSRAWLLTKILSPFVLGYWYLRYQAKEAVTASCAAVSSAGKDEAYDLIIRANLSYSDIEQIYVQALQAASRRPLTVDDFGAIVEQAVKRSRSQRHASVELLRAERDAATQVATDAQFNQAAETEQNTSDAEPATATSPPTDTPAPPKSHLAQLIDIDIADDADDQKHRFNAWDLHALYRLSPTDARKCVSLQELFVGLALLCRDQRSREEVVAEAEEQVRQIEAATGKPINLKKVNPLSLRVLQSARIQPLHKLHFAFLVSDQDRDGQLSVAELQGLIEHMIRTGHIKTETLKVEVPLRQRATPASWTPIEIFHYLSPQYRLLSAGEIAAKYMSYLPYVEALQAADDQSVRDVALQYHNGQTPAPAHPPPARIGRAEFQFLANHFTRMDQAACWYLIPLIQENGSTVGSWYRFKQRVKQNVKTKLILRQARQQEQRIHAAQQSMTETAPVQATATG